MAACCTSLLQGWPILLSMPCRKMARLFYDSIWASQRCEDQNVTPKHHNAALTISAQKGVNLSIVYIWWYFIGAWVFILLSIPSRRCKGPTLTSFVLLGGV